MPGLLLIFSLFCVPAVGPKYCLQKLDSVRSWQIPDRSEPVTARAEQWPFLLVSVGFSLLGTLHCLCSPKQTVCWLSGRCWSPAFKDLGIFYTHCLNATLSCQLSKSNECFHLPVGLRTQEAPLPFRWQIMYLIVFPWKANHWVMCITLLVVNITVMVSLIANNTT